MTQLHIAHDWGGGLERWLEDYVRTDRQSPHLILRSQVRYDTGCLNHQLNLYDAIDAERPVRSWTLQLPIYGASIYHAEYQYVLREIVTCFAVKTVMISSFIGHSLDLLRTGLPTIVVGHDYFPFCPAIVIFCGQKTCQTCHLSELQSCLKENPLNAYFPSLSSMTWMRLRESFVEALQQPNVAFVAPSASVQNNFVQLSPGLKAANFVEISHGLSIAPWQAARQTWMDDFDRNLAGFASVQSTVKLKVLLLGRLSDHKGFSIFQAIAPRLREQVEFVLIGCGDEVARKVTGWPGVTVIAATYDRADLPQLLLQISPDLCLFLSFWSETFCYTLSEAMLMGIPPVAFPVGSFVDRIQDGSTGLLAKPIELTEGGMSDAIVTLLQTLVQNPEKLQQVKLMLREQCPRTLEAMVQDYHDLIVTLQTQCQEQAIEPFSGSSSLPIDAAYQMLFDEVTELQSQVRVLNAKIARQTLESEKYFLMIKQSVIWKILKRSWGLSQKVKHKLQAMKRRV